MREMESIQDEWEDYDQKIERLQAGLAALPDKQREVLIKCFVEGKKYREIADEIRRRVREELGLTEGPEWSVYYYPAQGQVGLIEFALSGAEGAPGTAHGGGETGSSGAETADEKNPENLETGG